MYQVDPFGKRKAEQLTMGSDGGGKFEAFAYDVRNAVSVLFPFTYFPSLFFAWASSQFLLLIIRRNQDFSQPRIVAEVRFGDLLQIYRTGQNLGQCSTLREKLNICYWEKRRKTNLESTSGQRIRRKLVIMPKNSFRTVRALTCQEMNSFSLPK